MEIKDKDEVARILRDKGFDTINDSGVVITRFATGYSKEYYMEQTREVKRVLDEIGYKASRGFHILKEESLLSGK